MVFDDEKAILEVLSAILSVTGFEVEVASNGQEVYIVVSLGLHVEDRDIEGLIAFVGAGFSA